MTTAIHRMRVRSSDFDVGIPLAWSLYDRDGSLVLKAGEVLETQTQREAMLTKGLYREPGAERCSARRREAGENDAPELAGERLLPLERIKLAIGDSFQIQSQTDPAESRYYVRLIGYLKGKSVLVTVPEADGRLCLVREGQAFVVRFFAGRNAYAFAASVLRSSSMPFPHMHLSYPSQVRGLVVRAGERVPVRISCAIAIPDDVRTVAVAGLLTNLSISGGMLSSKTRLGNKGDPVSIKFRMDIHEIEFLTTIDATIRSVSRDEAGEFLHGIRFTGLSNEVAIALTALVYQKLADSAR